MMQPTFEQVLDYVSGGEQDSHVEEMLKHDPDGPEKLKQARLLLDVISRQDWPESDDEDAHLATSKPLAVKLEPSRLLDEDSADSQMAFRLTRPPSGEEQVRDIANLVSKYADSVRKLGTLTVLDRDEQIFLTFRPEDDPNMPPLTDQSVIPQEIRTYYQAAVASSESYEKRRDAIRIDATNLTISLTDKLSADKPLFLRFASTHSGEPVPGRHIVFMPDTGPFVRIATDRKGIAKLVAPLVPGVLRFYDGRTVLLRIHVKNSPTS